MSVLGPGRRWYRRRRASRLRRRARSLDPADLAGSGTVAKLERIATTDGEAALRAIEGLAAVARNGQSHPLRDDAEEALLDVLDAAEEDLQGRAARSLRYVALEREPFVPRLDDPLAAILDEWNHAAHRSVAVDAGMLLAREDPRSDLPRIRETLRELLTGGPPDARDHAALAYVLAAEDPDRFDHPETVAEHLAIVAGDREDPLPDPDSSVRTLADGRTLAEAVDAFAGATGP